jgi:SAM-dependent methyltransferase
MKIQDLNKNYDVIAGQFSASRQNLRWPLEALFFEKLKMIERPRILDLGCGSGRFYQYLKDHQTEFKNGFEYIGLDQSIELIKQARAAHSEADWRVGAWQNVADLNLGKFDAIVALASFHHLPRNEQERGLVALREIMNDDSFLFLTVWNLWKFSRAKNWWFFIKDRLFLSSKKFVEKYQFEKKDLSTWQDTLMLWQQKTPLFYYAFRQGELRGLADKLGFSEIVCQYENDSWRSGDNLYLIAKK